MAVLALGGSLALAACELAARSSDLWSAARCDGLNATFLGLCPGTLGAIGNGIAILAFHRATFAWRWWLVATLVGLVFGGVALGFGWSVPLGLAIAGGTLLIGMEILHLLALPFEVAHLVLTAVRVVSQTGERALGTRDRA